MCLKRCASSSRERNGHFNYGARAVVDEEENKGTIALRRVSRILLLSPVILTGRTHASPAFGREILLCLWLACGPAKSVHGDGGSQPRRGNNTMDNAVLMEIENLRRVSLAGLREKYREVFQEETRCRHREHLFRRIAWRLQARAEGDLSARARGRAQEIARDVDLRVVAPRDFFSVAGRPLQTTPGDRDRPDQDRRLPLPGVLLSRKWKGRTVLVEVLTKGFRYENRYYSSLSAIASAVTGTRWNGLAFFGLTRKAGEQKELLHAQS